MTQLRHHEFRKHGIVFSSARRTGLSLHGGTAARRAKATQSSSQLARMGYEPGLATSERQRDSDQRQAAALLRKRRREIRLEW
jgi:hypothetical protein